MKSKLSKHIDTRARGTIDSCIASVVRFEYLKMSVIELPGPIAAKKESREDIRWNSRLTAFPQNGNL